MMIRTEYYGSKRTPCLVVSNGNKETWVSIDKVKAVLAAVDEAKEWVSKIDKPAAPKPTVADMAAEIARLTAQVNALKVGVQQPARIDPIVQGTPFIAPNTTAPDAPEQTGQEPGKPASKLAALVATVAGK